MVWTLTVHGAPRTKKTSNILARAGGRHVVLPSAAWKNWAAKAPVIWECVVHGASESTVARSHRAYAPPIAGTVNCCALFYRDANRGDAVGYYQGLADLLEKRGILENDKLIVSWDGSRLLIDRERPRVEITLEAI